MGLDKLDIFEGAGLGTEVYMTPQPLSSKTGAQQFDEMYNMLIGANIYVKSIWVQVTSPNNWSTSSSMNVNFLNSILAEALQYGLNIGIYTNSDEWKQIVGGATTRNVNLWYWKTKGSGASNESPANFNDFKSFGSWTQPTVKQFAQVESICGVIVNRAYTGDFQGQIDPYSVTNIQNAAAAGLGTEVYMTPQPTSSKTGAQQFDEMYNMLIGGNIYIKAVWVQVVSPDDWTSSSTTNINFLNSILSRAMQLGLTVGVYTSKHEWNQITDHATTLNVRLWYWKTNGSGEADESPANFKDFKEFGSWTAPTVKQYGQFETICGVIVNRDIYSTSSAVVRDMASQKAPGKIVVGGLGFQGVPFTGNAKIIPK
nr:Protein LYS-6 [Haemonchus contortus]